MIESGGTTVIGVSITACLTTFKDAIKSCDFSKDKLNHFVINYGDRFPVESKEVVIFRVAWFLDKAVNPKLLRLLPASKMIMVAQRLIVFSSHLLLMLRFVLSEEFIELCLYHTALLCRYLRKDSKLALLVSFLQQRNVLWQALRGVLDAQSYQFTARIYPKKLGRRTTIYAHASIGGCESLSELIKAGSGVPQLSSNVGLPF